MGAVISSVARPVQGGSTDFGGGLFGGLLGKVSSTSYGPATNTTYWYNFYSCY
jgi:hypothetical protein